MSARPPFLSKDQSDMKHLLELPFRLIISPRQHDQDLRNREIVLKTLLAGTLLVSLLALVFLGAKILFAQQTFLEARFLAVVALVAFVGTLYVLSRVGWYKTASILLVFSYLLIAEIMVLLWGVNLPMGVLLFSLVLVLAGILLGPKYSLYTAGVIVVSLTVTVRLANTGVINPDLSWASKSPGITDVVGYSFVLGVIALVSWLFNLQMARSLHKAERAEAELLEQKALLEITVQKRTRELQTVQLEKIQQMYRFAELGQLSTAMMHDLANHLTSLTLNIENLQGEKRSKVLSGAKRSIRHIDEMVARVRDQLHGRSEMRLFNVATEIENMVCMLRHRGHSVNVQLNWQPLSDKKTLVCRGEPIRFRQMIANLITNGFDAYYEEAKPDERREVLVTASSEGQQIVITVNDWGRGIPRDERSKLFEPFHSTKQTGMGMGLFIVRQIVEDHFLGSVRIDNTQKHTAFVVRLPKAGE